ncbi:hypothetical protein CVT24_009531, partial [Panaeolus cyanescens]
HLKSSGQRKPLVDIAFDISASPHGRNPPCFGVDLSPLVDECVAAAHARSVNGHLPGGMLYTLFHKLVKFLDVPATFLFVFDGPDRPKIKRGKQVRHQIWWAAIVENLIQAFGFKTHHAPGEAEAELALLNSRGFIDAIITSDSDAFVFGTLCIIRAIPSNGRTNNKQFDDEYELYTQEKIPREFRADRGGLLLFALLSGGDYSTGISRCGPVTALALVRCGFGDRLLDGIKQFGFEANVNPEGTHGSLKFTPELVQYLNVWRQDLCKELQTNSQGFLTSQQQSMAVSILQDNDFPNAHVTWLYAHPKTSEYNSGQPLWYLLRKPNLFAIKEFCHSQLQWVSEEVQIAKFTRIVFPGVVKRMLYFPLTVYDDTSKKLISPGAQVVLERVGWKARKGKFTSRYGSTLQPQLTVSVQKLLEMMGIQGRNEKIVLWVAPHALPPKLQHPIKAKHKKINWMSKTHLSSNAIAGPSRALGDGEGGWSKERSHRLGIIDLTAEDSDSSNELDEAEVIDLTH